ncbi:MAG: tetratricopeptide repeat protein [Desulfovibrio sp.]|nr:tetratricopeptide repeat protein [Desulfovibrio sp.]
MNPQKNQDESASPLLRDIQAEVNPESAPLLQFITRYASAIAGVVLLLLLALGGMAVWNWYHHGKQEEARAELARINAQLKGKDRDAALSKLAEGAPESTKLFIYMSLGQSAQENGDPILAADAYAKAAKLDGDGALGLTAALGSVGSLLMQNENVQALALLQELEAKLPESRRSVQLRQMLAEAASRAGKTELAYKTYLGLAEEVKTPEGAYFRSRAEALAAKLGKAADAPAAQ